MMRREVALSFVDTDSYWSRWIANELRQLGYDPLELDRHPLRGFDEVVRHRWTLVLVVSRPYLEATMESLQSQSELWRAAREKWVTILCVVVSPCELPMMAKYVRLCTLTGMAQDAARHCFRQFISDTETAAFQPFQIASHRDGLPVEVLMRRHQEREPEINKDMPVTSTGLTATLIAAGGRAVAQSLRSVRHEMRITERQLRCPGLRRSRCPVIGGSGVRVAPLLDTAC